MACRGVRYRPSRESTAGEGRQGSGMHGERHCLPCCPHLPQTSPQTHHFHICIVPSLTPLFFVILAAPTVMPHIHTLTLGSVTPFPSSPSLPAPLRDPSPLPSPSRSRRLNDHLSRLDEDEVTRVIVWLSSPSFFQQTRPRGGPGLVAAASRPHCAAWVACGSAVCGYGLLGRRGTEARALPCGCHPLIHHCIYAVFFSGLHSHTSD